MRYCMSMVLALGASVAFAADEPFYVGGGIGGYHIEGEDWMVVDANEVPQPTRASGGDFSINIYGGWMLMDWLGFELKYSQYITTEEDDSSITSMRGNFYGAYVRGNYAVGESTYIYGLLGAAGGDQEVEINSIDGSRADEINDTELSYGVGIEAFPNDGAAGVRAEMVFHDDLDNWILSGGLTVRF